MHGILFAFNSEDEQHLLHTRTMDSLILVWDKHVFCQCSTAAVVVFDFLSPCDYDWSLLIIPGTRY